MVMDKHINDGGPAFPACNEAILNGTTGMTQRDWFAGQALAGIIGGYLANPDLGGIGPNDHAREAYELADAMLAARGGGAR